MVPIEFSNAHTERYLSDPVDFDLRVVIFDYYSWLAPEVNINNVIDIGCGDPAILLSFFDLPAEQKVGVDPYFDVQSNEYTHVQYNASDCSFPLFIKNKFDLVTMNHSFEHFSDPYSLMRNILTITHDRSYISIVVPDVESEWAFYDGHMTWWTPRSLSRFVEMHDIEVKKCEKVHSHSGLNEIRLLGRRMK